jgi:hypothetical protein
MFHTDSDGDILISRNSLVTARTTITSPDIDWTKGNVQHITTSSNIVITMTGGKDGGKYILAIRYSANGTTVEWPANVRFSYGEAPDTTSAIGKTDYFGFIYNGVDSKFDCVASMLSF